MYINLHYLYYNKNAAVDGEMEHALLQGDQGDDQNHNNEDFLNEQRTRLKLLSSNNARRNEEIDKFISAMGNLRDTLNNSNTASQRRSQNGDDEDGNEIDDSEPVDYIQIISDKMDDVYSKRKNDNDLEEYYDDEFWYDNFYIFFYFLQHGSFHLYIL